MGRLDNKVCLITGGAKGQGEAEARMFAAEGAIVWLADVLDDDGSRVATDIGGQYRHLDVRDADAWQTLTDEIVATHERIDVLVNNAGIFRPGRHFEITPQDFTDVMDVNCLGVFLGMRSVSPHMRQAEKGSIVNISSLAGLRASAGAFAYGTSKWAVRGMTKTAAVELGRRGIRVNSIHPGLIETDMYRQLPNSENPERISRRVPLGRVAAATEVANLALYLASDESSYSTGTEFVVDGGLSAM